jgi:pilus assembly protein CpaE
MLDAVVGESAVLVDADLQFGDVALLLQLDPSVTIADIAPQAEALSPEKLDSLLLRHESGLRVLPAPLVPSRASVKPKQVVRLIEQLQREYQVVVVDTSAVFDETLLAVLDVADDVFVIVDMDIPSVKNTKIALDTLRTSDYPMERMHLVINRFNSKSRLNVIEVERSLGMRVSASLPSDRLVPQSVNEGIPVVALSPRSRVARAFRSLVGIVFREEEE